MSRYVFAAADREKAALTRREIREGGAAAKRMRREGELALLERLLAELSMPEWYPER